MTQDVTCRGHRNSTIRPELKELEREGQLVLTNLEIIFTPAAEHRTSMDPVHELVYLGDIKARHVQAKGGGVGLGLASHYYVTMQVHRGDSDAWTLEFVFGTMRMKGARDFFVRELLTRCQTFSPPSAVVLKTSSAEAEIFESRRRLSPQPASDPPPAIPDAAEAISPISPDCFSILLTYQSRKWTFKATKEAITSVWHAAKREQSAEDTDYNEEHNSMLRDLAYMDQEFWSSPLSNATSGSTQIVRDAMRALLAYVFYPGRFGDPNLGFESRNRLLRLICPPPNVWFRCEKVSEDETHAKVYAWMLTNSHEVVIESVQITETRCGGVTVEANAELLEPSPESAENSRNEQARLDPQWILSAESPACMVCETDFGFFANRRHHCRNCGWSVCDACSSNALILDQWLADSKPHELQQTRSSQALRVCDNCYDVLEKQDRRQRLQPIPDSPARVSEGGDDEQVGFAQPLHAMQVEQQSRSAGLTTAMHLGQSSLPSLTRVSLFLLPHEIQIYDAEMTLKFQISLHSITVSGISVSMTDAAIGSTFLLTSCGGNTVESLKEQCDCAFKIGRMKADRHRAPVLPAGLCRHGGFHLVFFKEIFDTSCDADECQQLRNFYLTTLTDPNKAVLITHLFEQFMKITGAPPAAQVADRSRLKDLTDQVQQKRIDSRLSSNGSGWKESGLHQDIQRLESAITIEETRVQSAEAPGLKLQHKYARLLRDFLVEATSNPCMCAVVSAFGILSHPDDDTTNTAEAIRRFRRLFQFLEAKISSCPDAVKSLLRNLEVTEIVEQTMQKMGGFIGTSQSQELKTWLAKVRRDGYSLMLGQGDHPHTEIAQLFDHDHLYGMYLFVERAAEEQNVDKLIGLLARVPAELRAKKIMIQRNGKSEEKWFMNFVFSMGKESQRKIMMNCLESSVVSLDALRGLSDEAFVKGAPNILIQFLELLMEQKGIDSHQVPWIVISAMHRYRACTNCSEDERFLLFEIVLRFGGGQSFHSLCDELRRNPDIRDYIMGEFWCVLALLCL